MAKAKKYNVYKEHQADYITPKAPTLVETKPARYLAIASRGDPKGKLFPAKMGALYNVTFTVKMAQKFAGRDYSVSKLEGLWWPDAKYRAFMDAPPDTWNWKLMIRVPEFITAKEVDGAIAKLQKKGKPAEVAEVRLETLDEGRCVQMLHVGPYDAEAKTIAAMTAFAQAKGLAYHGLHHEIYLSDPRRVAPARLRTILRHPVR
jgi:hypothetical protein